MPNATHTAKVKHQKIETITITLKYASKHSLTRGKKIEREFVHRLRFTIFKQSDVT